MTKQPLWTCDRCGTQTTSDEMEGVWQPYQISTEEGHVCPDCYPAVYEGIQKLLNGSSQSSGGSDE